MTKTTPRSGNKKKRRTPKKPSGSGAKRASRKRTRRRSWRWTQRLITFGTEVARFGYAVVIFLQRVI